LRHVERIFSRLRLARARPFTHGGHNRLAKPGRARWCRCGRKCESHDFHGVGHAHCHGDVLPSCLCVRDGKSSGRPRYLNLRDDSTRLLVPRAKHRNRAPLAASEQQRAGDEEPRASRGCPGIECPRPGASGSSGWLPECCHAEPTTSAHPFSSR
jgi:hypothetical protein